MTRPFTSAIVLAGALLLVLAGFAGAANLPVPMRGMLMEILDRIEAQPDVQVAGESVVMPGELRRFYARRDYDPLWSTGDAAGRERIRAFLGRLEGDHADGLCDDDYHARFFRNLLEHFSITENDLALPQLRWSGWYDVLLTDALFHHARHLVEGRVQPDTLEDGWYLRREAVDLVEVVEAAVAASDLDRLLQVGQPIHPDYRALREALERYRKLAAFGGWPTIPNGRALRVGMEDRRLARLRTRLLLSGDLPEIPADTTLRMTAADAEALRRFQRRHGLYPDGILGAGTLAVLNVPVGERVRQLEINLERWRWLPTDLGATHLRVNIADFSASVVENGTPVLTMPVVVGNRYRKTPVFSARMTYIEFAPYWYVPSTILAEDKLPLLRTDPGYLDRQHYEIVGWDKETPVDPQSIDWTTVDAESFPGLLRQKPGPWNPLGRAKFILPNNFAVYLHDTNERQLFSRRDRPFSSGCIRLERPAELACYLLADQGWDRAQVEAAMAGDLPQQLYLRRPLPVHVLYWTAWVDETGQVHFRDDVYGRDRDLRQALDRSGRGCSLRNPALAQR